MPDVTLTVLATLASQAAGAALLAVLLLHFHRRYRKDYLRDWAWSWCAFALFLTASATALGLARTVPAGHPVRLALAAGGSFALQVQVLWLVRGARALSRGRPLPRGLFRALVVAAAALSLATTFAYAWEPAATGERYLLRVGVRAGIASAGFFAAGWMIWRARPGTIRSGPRLVAAAFFLYGVQQAHYLGLAVAGFGNVGADYAVYLGFADFLVEWAMGLGMVMCLLEDERAAALRAAERAEHLAYHDSLTGLPNRHLFGDRLEVALSRAAREQSRVAVMFLDLDRFKLVNDSLGHAAGDTLLVEASRRIRAAVREGDTLARVGSDEFTLLFPDVKRVEDAGRIAGKLLDAVRPPVELRGRELVVTASVGIALYPDDGEDAATLVQKADAAMYGAKETGRDRLQYSSAAMIERASEQLALESALRRAVEKGEMTPHYQPILDARTGRVHGVEALVRWRHPQRGLLFPAAFIRLAEQTGLAHRIGIQVLHAACAQTARWQRQGAEGLCVAVNLSADHFKDPALVAEVTHALRAAALEPHFLELEITEGLAMENAEASMATLHALKGLGVRISIDDFGTGYSSLSYLKRFPVDTLKVDRSLVADVHRDRGDEAIVAAVVTLARSMGMQVVAEGVEEEAQLAWVREHGCDLVQGYLFARPAPPEEVEAFVLEGRAAAGRS